MSERLGWQRTVGGRKLVDGQIDINREMSDGGQDRGHKPKTEEDRDQDGCTDSECNPPSGLRRKPK